ncbi:MAG TPA: TMEM14 family protein [Chthoniobacterales bacterium]|nr:TMEM14 family protein [Chthoniobacterales bacterium]
MIGPAKIYFIIFGLLTIVGGVIGYVKAGSTVSIIAGAISGIALIVAAFLLPGNVVLGLALAGLVSILLAGRFIPAFMKTGAVMPAGLMSVLSVIGIIMAIVAWIKK